MDLHSMNNQQILETISRHCPEAMTTYLHCFNRADRSGSCFFSRDRIEINMSESWRKFLSNIKKLACEGLLEWHPFNDGISVTIAEYDDGE